jgi:molybdate transport system substrate-binding protein
MRRIHSLFSTLAAAFLLFHGFTARAVEITVFAGVSLTDVLKEAALPYEKRTGDKIVFHFAPSGLLAMQIEEHSPADIFFCSDESKMNQLERQNLILKDTRKNPLSCALVIVVPVDSDLKIASAADLATNKVRRFAIADPKVDPAGIYSKTYLKKLGVWPAMESKVFPCDDVRATLAAVESGNSEAGMVFKTDARISKKVRVAYEVPVRDTPDICYSMAVLRDSKQVEAAKKFLQYLDSDEVAKILEKYGFIVLK